MLCCVVRVCVYWAYELGVCVCTGLLYVCVALYRAFLGLLVTFLGSFLVCVSLYSSHTLVLIQKLFYFNMSNFESHLYNY